MANFIEIFVSIILPVFILITLGVILQKKFSLDLYTLAKLNIYYFVPGIIFVKLYEAQFTMETFLYVLLFCIVFVGFLQFITFIIGRLFKFSKGMRVAFTNSVIFYNSANYGVPVNDLVFKSDPFAMSIQVVVLTFQNILTFSYGIFSLQSMDGGKLKALLSYFKMPLFYSMMFGVIFNVSNLPVPSFLWVPIKYISDGLIAVALLTLGAQIAQLRFSFKQLTIYLSLFIRLILGPVIAFCLVVLLNLDGILAQALIISSAMPTSVNSAIIAQEYKNEPEYAAQIVLVSTIFSAVTVTLVIFFTQLLF